MRVLLIEDDQHISDVIRRGLEQRGMSVMIASDGRMGFDLAMAGDHDLIILDLKLPVLDGTTVCTMLRSEGVTTPILMLTALGTSKDMELAFSHGADDYLVKPFDFNVLISRIRQLARLGEDVSVETLAVGDLLIDFTRRTVTREERRVPVTDMEFSLLECLVRHRGEVVTRTMLCEALGNIKVDARSTMIDTLVGILSRNLGAPGVTGAIETVPDEGFRFVLN